MMEAILSVVMPVYNEKQTVLQIIDKVLKLEIVRELIVVDDFSTDGTRELLTAAAFDDRVRIFFHDRNLGKGAALRTGFAKVTGAIVVIQDADLEYDPSEFIEMIRPIQEGVADVVYGSRLSGGKPQRVYMFWHRIGNGFLTFLTNLLYNTTLSDMETCYKMFRRDVLRQLVLEQDRFGFEPEVTAKLAQLPVRIVEVPIAYHGRTHAEGKKIGWKDGVQAVRYIFRYGRRGRRAATME